MDVSLYDQGPADTSVLGRRTTEVILLAVTFLVPAIAIVLAVAVSAEALESALEFLPFERVAPGPLPLP